MSDDHANHESEDPLEHALLHARHILPAQGPIGNFVHHNTLHAFQHMPFHEAVRSASEVYGTQGYLSELQYREAFAAGRITDADLDYAIERTAPAASDDQLKPLTHREVLRGLLLGDETRGDEDDALLDECLRMTCGKRPLGTARLLARVGKDRTDRDLLRAIGAQDPCELTNPVLVDFLGAYLDEGMARWHMPGREHGILVCFARYLGVAPTLLSPLLSAVKARLDAALAVKRPPADLAKELLAELGVAPADYTDYLTRTLLELPGFTGMVSRLEANPGDRDAGAPPCSLLELTVVRLALDLEAYRLCAQAAGYPSLDALHHMQPDPAAPEARAEELDRAGDLRRVCLANGITLEKLRTLGARFVEGFLVELDRYDDLEQRRVWHEAYERQHLREVLDAIAVNRARSGAPKIVAPRYQVAFCIDDREEAIRRHFEEQSDTHQTFGVAGFFGVAMRFQGIDDHDPSALCPVVVTPGHAIYEQPLPDHDDTLERRRRRRFLFARMRYEMGDSSRSLARGVALTPLLGMLSVFPLAFRILFPHAAARVARWVESHALPAPRTALVIERAEDHPARSSIPVGFTLTERTDRVQGTLENIGLVQNFAPLVTLLGHGASTVNNPHHSAYDCGACGGRSGGPNARAFAAMANDPAVRAELKKRGIDVPEGTWFLGGLHDTTTDDITLFDLEEVPAARRADLEALVKALDGARAMSAHERCRKFEHAPKHLTPEQALAHVQERSVDLSQARPELGHVTNAVCIVGRRALSRGIFLDRRSFLVSYDATIDPTINILERILGAVVPVGAGINLEYYFSTVDNEGYGCGTKLPHNLCGLLGVMEGSSGDLRTGLPRQMIEIHEPVRLLGIIEATPEAILEVARRKPEVAELVTREWVRIVSVHPETGQLAVFAGGKFITYQPELRDLPSVRTASEWYEGKLGFLSPVRIVPSGGKAA